MFFHWLSTCWFRPSASFLCFSASVPSSFPPISLPRLAFRIPYSLVNCSNISSSSINVLSLLLVLTFLSFVFLPCLSVFKSFSFRSPAFFLPIRHLFCHTVGCYMQLSFFYPLSTLSLLLRSLAAFLAIRLLRSIILMGFSILSTFRLRFFHLRVAISIPLLVCTDSFRLLLPHFGS